MSEPLYVIVHESDQGEKEEIEGMIATAKGDVDTLRSLYSKRFGSVCNLYTADQIKQIKGLTNRVALAVNKSSLN